MVLDDCCVTMTTCCGKFNGPFGVLCYVAPFFSYFPNRWRYVDLCVIAENYFVGVPLPRKCQHNELSTRNGNLTKLTEQQLPAVKDADMAASGGCARPKEGLQPRTLHGLWPQPRRRRIGERSLTKRLREKVWLSMRARALKFGRSNLCRASRRRRGSVRTKRRGGGHSMRS